MAVHSVRNTMENAQSMRINCSRLTYVIDVRASRRLFTTKWTLVKVMSLGLFIVCSVFLFFTSSSSTRVMIATAFDKQILLASIIALISIALLSCIVFLAQISFIDPLEKTSILDSEFNEHNWFSRFVQTLFHPFRVAVRFLVGATNNPQSWIDTSCGTDNKEMALDLVTVKDELLNLQSVTNDKLENLYKLLVNMQQKDFK